MQCLLPRKREKEDKFIDSPQKFIPTEVALEKIMVLKRQFHKDYIYTELKLYEIPNTLSIGRTTKSLNSRDMESVVEGISSTYTKNNFKHNQQW